MAAKSFIDAIYAEIGENDINQDVKDWLSTGFLPLNKAMSGKYAGGFPVGRIIEIYGGPSSGKTLLATYGLIETQRRGGLAIMLDFEHAFSIGRARNLGLIDDRMQWIYKQPATAEEGFKIIEFTVSQARKAGFDKPVTVVVDSVASMLTKEELEKDFGDGNMRTRISLPAVMSESLKKLAAMANKNNVTLIFLNQVRDNIGVMFGDKEKTPGGNALKFYASVRLRIGKAGKVKEGDEIIGEKVNVNVIKNKVFEPFKQAEYTTHLTNGVNLELSHFEELVRLGLIERSGAWYVLPSGEKIQGAKKIIEMLRDDTKFYGSLLAMFKD